MRLASIAWYVIAALAVTIFIASLPGYFVQLVGGQASPPVDAPAGFVFALNAAGTLASIAAALMSLILAAILFWRKRNEPMALFVSFFLIIYGIVLAGPLEMVESAAQGRGTLTLAAQAILLATPSATLLFIFPSGRFVPHWTRWLALLSIVWVPITLYLYSHSFTLASFDTVTLFALMIWLMSLPLAGVYAQVYRYRHVSSPIERQQTKWVVFGFALWFVMIMISTGPYLYGQSLPAETPRPWWTPMNNLIWWLGLAVLPLSLTMAVMRRRLWDIDLVINRTLVFGALTVFVVALYVLVVGLSGALFQSSGNLLVSLAATGLAAILFQPLRARLQRGVNRLMYGDRDDPYAVLSHLGQRLKATLSPEAVLPTVVETIAQALKLPYAAISLTGDERPTMDELSSSVFRRSSSVDGLEVVASYGLPATDVLRLPLVYQSETIGQLLVAPRAPSEPFTPAERRLLEDIAHQAGIAAHAVRLTADLQHSRERLVAAREEERRRIRRDLHDGLGPALASLTLKLDAARNLIARDPAAADSLLSEFKAQTQSAIGDIRRLVYDLRPPALDELGLLSSLREQAAQYNSTNGLRVSVEAPEPLPSLPAAVEVAAYRIVLEALTNVVRHAHAHNCTVRFWLGEALQVDIADDGVGLADGFRAGVGLTSMRERAAELGGTCVIERAPMGGTRVVARLPIMK